MDDLAAQLVPLLRVDAVCLPHAKAAGSEGVGGGWSRLHCWLYVFGVVLMAMLNLLPSPALSLLLLFMCGTQDELASSFLHDLSLFDPQAHWFQRCAQVL